MLLETAPMLRLRLLALRRDERALLERLGELGVVQLAREPAPEARLARRDFTEERARWAELATRAARLRQLLPVGATRGPVPHPTSSPEESLRALEARAAALLEEQRQVRERREVLERQAADARLYGEAAEALTAAQGFLTEAQGSRVLHFLLGTVPDGRMAELTSADAVLLPLGSREGRQALVAVTQDRHLDSTRAALLAAGFAQAPASLLERPAREPAEGARLQERQARVESALAALAAESAPLLSALRARAEHEATLHAARGELERTEACVLLTGWLPAAAAPALEAALATVAGGQYCLELVRAADLHGEEAPVLLAHARLLQPFAALIRAYGLPRYGELAPTIFMALSYVLMFGMMFGDAGHGLLLAGAGLWLLRRPRLHDAGVIACCAGASSTLFGVLYGSYFGLEGARSLALWRDPLAGNPSALMLVAVGLGVVLISLGLILNVVNRLRRREVWQALADGFGISGMVFYWGVLALALGHGALAARGAAAPILAAVVGLPLLVWLLREPLEHRRRHEGRGLLAACITALVEAFETVLVYLANTISFVRLAAYAMSHAALLLAIATLAHEIGRVPAVGGVLAALVFVGGNLVIIVLEGIIAAVQALRLEYYEFFGKFLSGSGRPFTPFRLERCGVPWAVDWEASSHRQTREVAS